MRIRFSLQHFAVLEAGLAGLFFVQALRLLIGLLYSRAASAALASALDPGSIDRTLPGLVEAAVFTREVSFLVYMLALPLLAILLGRSRFLIAAAAALIAVGRALMTADEAGAQTMAAALVMGAGLLYTATMIRHRPHLLPYFFILGFGADQIFRAVGNTSDPSLLPEYGSVQIVLSIILAALALLAVTRKISVDDEAGNAPAAARYGLMPIWGGIGLGALLFLELTLLALPNAIAGRASADYTAFVPLTLAATLLPLVPWVRARARALIGAFDGGARGWLWMLLAMLLIVFGTRIQEIILPFGSVQTRLPLGGVALAAAQFTVGMLWWWLVRPQGERERNLSGLWLILSMIVLATLLAGDSFTYEYAFVRDLTPELAALNAVVPPLLRGFRAMGMGVLLVAVFLAALPMMQTRRRIAWPVGTPLQTVLSVLIVAAASIGAAYAARPPVIAGVRGVESIRVGTYNIHAGFNEFFDFDLEAIARTIERSGANVVLLQEVEAGRVTSFGIDQALWLARRLGMDRRFYPTNEGLQGLAVLSNVEIVFNDGRLLSSLSNQTGLQRVQIRPDAGVVTVYNTWLGLLLESPGGPTLTEQEQDQDRQLNEIFGFISGDFPDGNLGRIILGGTLNNTPTSPLIQRLRDTGFVDPFAGLPLELAATLWRTGLRARIDYLWIRPPLLATSAGAMDTHASDHRMSVVELQIVRR